MKTQLKPIKLRVNKKEGFLNRATEAWAYIDNKSIYIFIQADGENALSAHITEEQIRKALDDK